MSAALKSDTEYRVDSLPELEAAKIPVPPPPGDVEILARPRQFGDGDALPDEYRELLVKLIYKAVTFFIENMSRIVKLFESMKQVVTQAIAGVDPEAIGQTAEGILAKAEGPDAVGWTLTCRNGKLKQVLGFALSEVREARLVPVVDFKGRASRPGKLASGGGADKAAVDAAPEVDRG